MTSLIGSQFIRLCKVSRQMSMPKYSNVLNIFLWVTRNSIQIFTAIYTECIMKICQFYNEIT